MDFGIDDVFRHPAGSTISCPHCRGRLLRMLRSWSCRVCRLVFPRVYWFAREGELFPVRRAS